MIEKRRKRLAPGADMPVLIDVEDEHWRCLPDVDALAERAVAATFAHESRTGESLEVSVLLTGDDDAARINAEWRGKTYAPNVLSFPAPDKTMIPQGEAQPLGDIVLAAGVVAREAREQGKSLEAHVCHLVTHGTLHLLGYDHMNDIDTARMEAAEIAILRRLGYPDPYAR